MLDGARVIKVERKKYGDFARYYDTYAKGSSSYFTWLNAGKESLTVDIKDKNDKDLLHKIASKSDVVIQNLAPGATERANLGSKYLRSLNERLITLDFSGYGNNNIVYQHYKAYDLLVAAETGLCSITGSKTEPGRVGVSICDIVCGMNGYSGVLKALIQRSITGYGSSLEASLFESTSELLTVPYLQHESTGVNPKRSGLNHPSIAPYGVFNTKDNKKILISIQNEREWKSLCEKILNINPDIESFSTPAARLINRVSLEETINAEFKQHSMVSLKEKLLEASIAFGQVSDMAGLSEHPCLKKTKVLNEYGKVVEIIADSMNSEVDVIHQVPTIGQHTESIKEEFL